jgi:hypothetical protein
VSTRLLWPLAFVAASTIASITGTASAQEESPPAVPPARNAIEIGIAGGYAQGLGSFTRVAGDGVSDTAGPGAGFSLDLGIRMTERWMFGFYGGYGQFQRSDFVAAGSSVRSYEAGVQGQLHFDPGARVDPWIGLGFGYRIHVVSPDIGRDYLRHGLQLGRVRIGLDYRVSRAVSLGPVLGGDVTMIVSERPPGGSTRAIESDDLASAFFLFGGLQGRFDIIDDTPARPAYARIR